MSTPVFPPGEFAARRAKVFDALGPAHALLQGAGPVRGFEFPRQTNEFFYLTGLETPQAYLLLDGVRRQASLYLPHRDTRADDDGPTADEPDTVRRLTGVDSVFGLEELAGPLSRVSALYLPHAPAEGKWECRDVLRHWAQQSRRRPLGRAALP